MNPDIPSVSTFRVEKPGKSKFAPSISGRKAGKDSSTATASTSSNTTANTSTPLVTEVDHAEAPQPEESLDFSSLLNTEVGNETTSQPASSQGKSQGTRIESVATRRQVAKEPSRGEQSSAPKLPEGPKNAASIATSATGEPAAPKQTMAYFLKDTKLGREMPVSSPTSAKGTTDRSSGRRVLNLKNIKASRSTTTALAPQVRVVNDKIVYDEEMVAVAAPSATDNIEDELEYVEDDEHKHLTSATYAKRTGSNRWNAQDTEFFYEALAMCGTDFSMIQTFFPHRSRAQVKGKFKIEERTSPARVAQALKQRKPFNASLKSRINKEEEQ